MFNFCFYIHVYLQKVFDQYARILYNFVLCNKLSSDLKIQICKSLTQVSNSEILDDNIQTVTVMHQNKTEDGVKILGDTRKLQLLSYSADTLQSYLEEQTITKNIIIKFYLLCVNYRWGRPPGVLYHLKT